MKVFIIYIRYFDEINNTPQIGGLQTYIENLCDVITSLGYETVIYQISTYDFERLLPNGARVIGKKCNKRKYYIELVREAERIADTENDLLLFLTSTLICKSKFKKTIAIQHGIYWDINTIHGKKVSFPFDVILRGLQTISENNRIRLVKKLVCVDYNYINWLRTQITARDINYSVIPNFSDITEKNNREITDRIKIIYARRFADIRGVGLICDFMPKLLEKYNNIDFTIAGNGERSDIIHQTFDKYMNVTITTYSPSESLSFHKQFDIALVPSIGSEGTSLSLIEAMAAGCAVVSSDIGGLSNLIIDGFNGRIVRPISEDFMQCVLEMIENKSLIEQYSNNGMSVVINSLSRKVWEEKWKDIFSEFQ